jgi:cytochrome c553
VGLCFNRAPEQPARREKQRGEDIVSRLLIIVAAACALATTNAFAQGVDPDLARNLAATCANCHGTNGRAEPGSEPLAGKPKEEIVRKMQEFKTGQRPASIMHQLAKGYTNEQIELIAGYFAAQKAK